jgi:tRNA-guanine transglycosylase
MALFTPHHTDKDTRARTGVIHTAHGDIATPVFMPCGTQGTVKSVDSADLEHIGAQIILGNTYHLHLRPGEVIIDRAGGLHRFMSWPRPILTDSGGFQVFSLQSAIGNRLSSDSRPLVSIDDDGVTFRSHLDGSSHRFTPEIAIDIQHNIGADIIMAFDECTSDAASYEAAERAMDRTHRWALQCLAAHRSAPARHGYPQYLFGIIQGAKHRELREASARAIAGMGFDGIAIGGESVGYNMDATKDILDWVIPLLPDDVPHYTMGVGFSPMDLFEVVERGVDMFDCVAPTRMARNGTLFVRDASKRHRINITNAAYREDAGPIDAGCLCPACTVYSRRYVHHLFHTQELLAYRLATLHNLTFLFTMMAEMRTAINEDRFLPYKRQWM